VSFFGLAVPLGWWLLLILPLPFIQELEASCGTGRYWLPNQEAGEMPADDDGMGGVRVRWPLDVYMRGNEAWAILLATERGGDGRGLEK